MTALRMNAINERIINYIPMKKILYASILLLFAASSCQNFLEKEPVNAVSDAHPIFDQKSAETALNGVYRELASAGYYGETYVTLGFFPSGDIKNLTTGGAANLVNINYRADDVNFNTAWKAIYSTINRANNVIAKIPSVEDPTFTQTLKDQYIGEAKLIRALAYFDLARAWGGVQLILEPTTSLVERADVQRSSLDETYQQILKDLQEAEQVLPESVNRIRATRHTVWALRARLHLYREEWALAEEYATKLINLSTDYYLLKPFNAWFANNVTGTAESVFELQYSALNQSAIRNQMQHPTNGGTYRYAPNDRFVQLLNNQELSGGRKTLIGSVTQSNTTIWFGNLYYRLPATDPAYVIRIAELYLIRAEARAHLQHIAEGTADLNTIRERAEVPLSTANTQEALLLAIENERRIEFAFEAHRWFDLSRTGRAKTVLESLDQNTHVEAYELLFPIPIEQVQLDENLTQNPGY